MAHPSFSHKRRDVLLVLAMWAVMMIIFLFARVIATSRCRHCRCLGEITSGLLLAYIGVKMTGVILFNGGVQHSRPGKYLVRYPLSGMHQPLAPETLFWDATSVVFVVRAVVIFF